MNFVFISPNFPVRYYKWAEALKDHGITVLGIGDSPLYDVHPRLLHALTEYYFVKDLSNIEDLKKACQYFQDKYGKIDYIESDNEWWLYNDSVLRKAFNVTTGFYPEDMEKIKAKSAMKECFINAGAKVMRYTLVDGSKDLEKALNFTLISEGWLRNENTYGDAVTLRVRLHSLITSSNSNFFKWEKGTYISLENYLSDLMITNGKKYQLVNINLIDVDDDFAKVITKIYSRLLFEFTKSLKTRASIPFHILVEEAHRYIQNDRDRFLIGYNIFERIAKEGRKYGLILGLITQRPVEMSDTVISQCSNFLIFKMNHPTDVEYIKKMVPNISDEIVEKQKSLQSGTCLAFGSAFKIPLIVKLKMPNPMPTSGNCDVVKIWDGHSSEQIESKEVNNNQEQQSTNVTSERVESNTLSEQSIQEPTNIGIPELNQKDLEITNEQTIPVNNEQITNILDVPKEEEHRTTFNIGDESTNISNPSLDILNNSVKDQTVSVSTIPEININNDETL